MATAAGGHGRAFSATGWGGAIGRGRVGKLWTGAGSEAEAGPCAVSCPFTAPFTAGPIDSTGAMKR